jgi:hypothetical protein
LHFRRVTAASHPVSCWPVLHSWVAIAVAEWTAKLRIPHPGIMTIRITLDRHWPARAFAVGLGLTIAPSGWHIDTCWLSAIQRKICTVAAADLPHDHRPDNHGGRIGASR